MSWSLIGRANSCMRPRRATLRRGGGCGWGPLCRAMCRAGSRPRLLAGRVTSASPPILTLQRVATARTSHSPAARCESVMCVRCHCHAPRLVLKEHSIQAQAYQLLLACSGIRSVSMSQGSAEPGSQRASKVASTERPLKQCTAPVQAVLGRGRRSPKCARPAPRGDDSALAC